MGRKVERVDLTRMNVDLQYYQDLFMQQQNQKVLHPKYDPEEAQIFKSLLDEEMEKLRKKP